MYNMKKKQNIYIYQTKDRISEKLNKIQNL